MAKFDLKDYEPVEERIKRFYSDHPDGRITADLLTAVDKLETVIVKAYLYIGEDLVSTGLAFEKFGEGFVNKTSHLENCETSAIGRALANYNYAGSRRPSREEMQKTQPKEPEKNAAPKKENPERKMILEDIGELIKAGKFTDAYKKTIKGDITASKTNADLKAIFAAIKGQIPTDDPGLNAAFDGKDRAVDAVIVEEQEETLF